jgi:hypothetical protein
MMDKHAEREAALNAHAEALIQGHWHEIAAETNGPTIATVMAHLKPRFRALLQGRLSTGEGDGRTVEFDIHMRFWDVTGGTNEAILVAESDVERVRSHNGVFKRVAEAIQEVHEGETLSDSAAVREIAKKRSSLRTMLSRSNGETTLRVVYKADGVPHLAQTLVSRVVEEEAEG